SINLEDYYFQLVRERKPTIGFDVEFLINNKYFIYSLEIDKKEISETLSLSGIGKSPDRVLFKRIGSEIKQVHLQNADSAKQLLEMNSRSSLLPLNQKFPVLSDENVKLAFKWFNEKLEIVSINSTVPSLINIMSDNPGLLQLTNDIFENI